MSATINNREQSKRIVSFGEVMMRFSPPGFMRLKQAQSFNVWYGGSEANVSVSLSAFGLHTEHVTCVSSNDFGDGTLQWLNKHGVATDHVARSSHRTGIYFMEQGAMQRSSRVVYDRADSAFANLKAGSIDWDDVMRNASWFHWSGITPAISADAAKLCLEALTAARKHKVVVSADINYRRNLWQYGKQPLDVMPELIAMSDHIVGGVTDFENCCEVTGSTYEAAAEKLIQKFPHIISIASTMRDQSSASSNTIKGMLYFEKELFESKSYSLDNIIDRIGAGDAFMAGLIYGWTQKLSPQGIIEYAVAAGAWKHSVEGDVNIASVGEIQQLMKGENVGKLLR